MYQLTGSNITRVHKNGRFRSPEYSGSNLNGRSNIYYNTCYLYSLLPYFRVLDKCFDFSSFRVQRNENEDLLTFEKRQVLFQALITLVQKCYSGNAQNAINTLLDKYCAIHTEEDVVSMSTHHDAVIILDKILSDVGIYKQRLDYDIHTPSGEQIASNTEFSSYVPIKAGFDGNADTLQECINRFCSTSVESFKYQGNSITVLKNCFFNPDEKVFIFELDNARQINVIPNEIMRLPTKNGYVTAHLACITIYESSTGFSVSNTLSDRGHYYTYFRDQDNLWRSVDSLKNRGFPTIPEAFDLPNTQDILQRGRMYMYVVDSSHLDSLVPIGVRQQPGSDAKSDELGRLSELPVTNRSLERLFNGINFPKMPSFPRKVRVSTHISKGGGWLESEGGGYPNYFLVDREICEDRTNRDEATGDDSRVMQKSSATVGDSLLLQKSSNSRRKNYPTASDETQSFQDSMMRQLKRSRLDEGPIEGQPEQKRRRRS